MRTRRADALLFVGIASWLTIACTSGIGQPANNFDDPYESAPSSRESPGAGREAPGDGREAPPSSTENPGSQGGGPGSAGNGSPSACPPCDQKYNCVVVTMSGGMTKVDQSENIELETKNGACVLDEDDTAVALQCGGKLTLNGQPFGSWAASGNMLVISASQGGSSATLTCTLRTSSTPTPTTTAVPTSDLPPPVVDAGIRDSSVKDAVTDTGTKG